MKSHDVERFLNENVPCFQGGSDQKLSADLRFEEGTGQKLEVDWDYQHCEQPPPAPSIKVKVNGLNVETLDDMIVKKMQAATHIREDASEEEKRAAVEVGGARFNEGKVRFDLVPPDALWELAKVYTFGARKYRDRNWEKGMSWGICFAAAMRHLWKWWRGERNDPESGIHHLAHAAWNCLSALAYELREQTEFDDRYKLGQPRGFSLPHD